MAININIILIEKSTLKINQIILFIEDMANTLFVLTVLGSNIIIKTKVKKITKNINKLFTLILNIITKGIIFWIVDNMKRVIRDLVFRIEINQEWKGLIPNFINNLKFIKM